MDFDPIIVRHAATARWFAPRALVVGTALLLFACGGGDAPRISDESGEPWRMVGTTCVRESEEGPLRRVINHVDPELCGRHQRHRSPVYVRIQPSAQEQPR